MSRFDDLKKYIKSQGWEWKPGKQIPYGNQIIVIANEQQTTVNFYPKRGKFVLGGAHHGLRAALNKWIIGDQQPVLFGSDTTQIKNRPGIVLPSRLDELKAYIREKGWHWGPGAYIPHGEQIIVSDSRKDVQINFWPKREKIVVQGSESSLKRALLEWVGELSAENNRGKRPFDSGDHFGMDESGKGDPLGPLVVAAVFVSKSDIDRLIQVGVQDSKLLSGDQLQVIAGEIERIIPPQHRSVFVVAPEVYNNRYARVKNLNQLLALVYAETLKPIWTPHLGTHIICDQFSRDPQRLEQSFVASGLPSPTQQTKAEQASTAVAAASILATAEFHDEMKRLGALAGLIGGLPRGASNLTDINATVRFILQTQGEAGLRKFAKIHFKTIKKLL